MIRRRPFEQGRLSELGVTEDAIKGQVRNILSKLNDRTQAAVLGLKRGIIS